MNGRASTRLQLVATLVFAALLTTVLAAGSAILRPGPSCVPVLIWSSQEKFGMLSSLADRYNRLGRLVDGRCVTITVRKVNSGDAEQALEKLGSGVADRPDVWSPASSAWVKLLAFRSQGGAAVLPSPLVSQNFFQSPLVIGMPEPMASALNPTPIGWADILKLAQDPAGWGRYGRKEWGMFLLGKTIPTVSTSGLHALIGTYYAATGGHMTIDRVKDSKVNAFVSGVESSVVHYGVTASDFLRNLRFADDQDSALSYISAIAVEEKELIDYNKGLVGGVQKAPPKVRLVPIYPSDGMPVADHPFVILTHAAAKAGALQSFYDFLRQREIQETFDVNGFRYANGDAGTEMHKQKFVDTSLPGSQIPSPEGKVLDAMQNAWKAFRKPARVLILVDVSADPNALKLATEQLGDAIRQQFQARDLVGVWTFPAPTTPYTELRPVSPVKDGLDITLKTISPIKGTAADLGFVVQAAIRSMADSYDRNRVDAVLLVEMSPDASLTTEQIKADRTLQLYLGNQPANRFIHLFTVGPVGNKRLQNFASFGQGIHYDPGTASDLLNDVISSI